MAASDQQISASSVPWRRMIVEGGVIILSILLAFAIDAGWDSFRERNQEQAFLVSLLSDFKEARNRIDANTDEHLRFIRLGQQLLDLHGDLVTDVTPEALETMLGAVFFDFRSLYLPSGSRDALFASGDIEIISNLKLRAMLAAWPSVVADAAEDERFIADDVLYNSSPFLRDKIATRNVARITNSDAREYIPALQSVRYEALRNDPKFDNMVSFRILSEVYVLFENGRLGEACDDIIAVIESELDR